MPISNRCPDDPASCCRTTRSRPPFVMTVTTSRLLRSVPSASRASAQIPITASPSTSRPRSSTAISRSASPSKANPTSRPAAETVSARRSGCVEPQPSLIFVPSGASNSTVTSAPSVRNSSGAMTLAEPLAQSRPSRSPTKASPAISDRWRCVAERSRPGRGGHGRAPRWAGRDPCRVVDQPIERPPRRRRRSSARRR